MQSLDPLISDKHELHGSKNLEKNPGRKKKEATWRTDGAI